MSTTALSTRCDTKIYNQIKAIAKKENLSTRWIIEKARNYYYQDLVRQSIISSYSNLDNDDLSILEEDMFSYYQDSIDDL